MKRRGRPVLGAFAGLFFGLSIAMLLVLFGAVTLDTGLLIVLPLLFLVLGVVWGFLAPLSPRGGAGSAQFRDELL
jgi:hypothetical protein